MNTPPSDQHSNVFHVVMWTEGPKDIVMTLGMEGAIASRVLALRVVEAHKDNILAGYEVSADPTAAWRTRVGILEMPASDPRFKHPAPLTNVDAVCADLYERAHAKRAKAQRQ